MKRRPPSVGRDGSLVGQRVVWATAGCAQTFTGIVVRSTPYFVWIESCGAVRKYRRFGGFRDWRLERAA